MAHIKSCQNHYGCQLMTLCKYECMILSHDVSKILTACRMLQILIAQRQMKAKIHSFPTMYILGGDRCGRNGSNHGFRPRIRLKTILICSLENMGKNLQNELWVRPVPSKLSERRPLTFFSPSRHGKWAKRCFSHFSQLLQYKNF